MESDRLAQAVENLDRRLANVEQILPTLATKADLKPLATKAELKSLATKEELREAVSKPATKDELREAVSKLATKEELHEAVSKLATKEELREAVSKLATKEELREEGEKSRRYMKVLVEGLSAELKVYVEKCESVDRRDSRQHADALKTLAAHDTRLTSLEAPPRKRGR